MLKKMLEEVKNGKSGPNMEMISNFNEMSKNMADLGITGE